MHERPPISQIAYIDADGNQREYIVGQAGTTAITEKNEGGEYGYIPWVEVWRGEALVARFNQHTLQRILY